MTGRQRCRMQKLYKLLAMVDDALIAPGATNTERLLGYGAGVCGAIFAGTTGALQGISGFGIVLLIVGGFDLFGGAVVNATPSCSRRFHTGKRSRGSALGFIAGHIHTLVLAAVLPTVMPRATAIVAYAGVLLAVALIVSVRSQYRPPVAFGLAVILIAICLAIQPLSPAVVWVIPVLVIKLLLSHLLPHPANEL